MYDGYYCGDLRLVVVDPPETAQVQSIMITIYNHYYFLLLLCVTSSYCVEKATTICIHLQSIYNDDRLVEVCARWYNRWPCSAVTLARNDV